MKRSYIEENTLPFAEKDTVSKFLLLLYINVQQRHIFMGSNRKLELEYKVKPNYIGICFLMNLFS